MLTIYSYTGQGSIMKIPWPFDLVFDVNILIRNVIRDAVYVKKKGKVEG